MKHSTKVSKCLFLCSTIIIGLFSIGCGSQKIGDGSSNQASRIGTDDSSGKVAQCNSFDSSFIDADMKVLHDSGGNASFEFVYLKMNSINTSNFSSTANYYIRLFKWEALDHQSTDISETPLEFRLELKGYGQSIPISGYYDTLSYTVLQNIINEHNDGNPFAKVSGSSPQEWFEQIHFVVSGIGRYDHAIKIAGYNNDDNDANGDIDTLLHETDALIPAFYSNPNTYSSLLDPSGNERSRILINLHPFKNNKDNWSEDRFYHTSESYCFDTQK